MARPRKTDQAKKLDAETREFRKKRAELEAYQDLRFNVVSLLKNSDMSFEDIHAHCGPCPATLIRWFNPDIMVNPQFGKMRSALRIIGYDFGIVERPAAEVIPLERKA